ncbi:MAG: hypothetical protein ACREBW_00725, partial [Candidatus Micrarchaeaceae archaeon]
FSGDFLENTPRLPHFPGNIHSEENDAMNNDRSGLKSTHANDALTVTHLEKSLTVSHLAQSLANMVEPQDTNGTSGQLQGTVQRPTPTQAPVNGTNQTGPMPTGDKR